MPVVSQTTREKEVSRHCMIVLEESDASLCNSAFGLSSDGSHCMGKTLTSPTYIMCLERCISPYPLTECSEHYPAPDLGFSEWDVLGIYKHRGKESVGQEDNQKMEYQEHTAPD
ncbi:uncharacterized protein LJ206_009552 isoform 1-T2 [Theristicus caerulescens]